MDVEGAAGSGLGSAAGDDAPAKGWWLLADRRPFGQSLIWQWQDAYFAESGVEAWRGGEVPHYVTSNPTIANSYAEILLAFRRDRQRLAPDPAPLTIVELGAGSGRFAFHFLRRLQSLCDEAGLAPQDFRYVLTDAAAANLDFWRRHPCFEPYFADGRLDIALFDITRPDDPTLQISGERLQGSVRHPLVVIANYVFDSIPQELFHFKERRAFACHVTLAVDADPAGLAPAELLARLRMRYDDKELSEPPYRDRQLRRLFALYQRELRDAYVLLPAAGLRCLSRLAGMSAQGLLLLSADKGSHRLADLEGRAAPLLVRHGSVSLSVNYHAFAEACREDGGLAMMPADHPAGITIIGLLMTASAADHAATRAAYRRHVEAFGPDHFYSIVKSAREHIPTMSASELLALLRLSRDDSQQFGRFLPRLLQLAPGSDAATRQDIIAAVARVWEMYFPLGEELDLARLIGELLYALDDPAGALDYFERSMAIYGIDTGTLYNIAACYRLLGEHEAAASVLRKVLAHDRNNDAARRLLAACEEAAAFA